MVMMTLCDGETRATTNDYWNISKAKCRYSFENVWPHQETVGRVMSSLPIQTESLIDHYYDHYKITMPYEFGSTR